MVKSLSPISRQALRRRWFNSWVGGFGGCQSKNLEKLDVRPIRSSDRKTSECLLVDDKYHGLFMFVLFSPFSQDLLTHFEFSPNLQLQLFQLTKRRLTNTIVGCKSPRDCSHPREAYVLESAQAKSAWSHGHVSPASLRPPPPPPIAPLATEPPYPRYPDVAGIVPLTFVLHNMIHPQICHGW